MSVPNEDIIIQMELMNYMGESLEVIAIYIHRLKGTHVTEAVYLPYLGNSSVFRFSVGNYTMSQAASYSTIH